MEDDYTLIDYSVQKPNKDSYPDWDTWFLSFCEYMRLKYRKTYVPSKKK